MRLVTNAVKHSPSFTKTNVFSLSFVISKKLTHPKNRSYEDFCKHNSLNFLLITIQYQGSRLEQERFLNFKPKVQKCSFPCFKSQLQQTVLSSVTVPNVRAGHQFHFRVRRSCQNFFNHHFKLNGLQQLQFLGGTPESLQIT